MSEYFCNCKLLGTPFSLLPVFRREEIQAWCPGRNQKFCKNGKVDTVLKNLKIRALGVLVVIALMVVSAACVKQDNSAGEGKRKLIVGTSAAFAPFEYLDKGEIVGFDIDLLAAIMKEAGYDYEVKNLGWDPLFETIRGKNADLGIAGIAINDTRKQTFDFSRPYYESTHMILVPEGSDIKSAKDLIGKKVGVNNGSTGQEATEKLLGRNSPDIKKYEDIIMAIMSLKNNDVQAVVTDNAVVNEYIKNNPNDKFVGITDKQNFEPEYYGLMFPKGSELKKEIDAAFQTILKNGTFSTIYKKWFGITPNVDVLLIAE